MYKFPHYIDDDEEKDEYLYRRVQELLGLGESWDSESALTCAGEEYDKGARL